MSIPTFCVLFVRVKVGSVSYCLHAAYDRLSLTEINQHQTLNNKYSFKCFFFKLRLCTFLIKHFTDSAFEY